MIPKPININNSVNESEKTSLSYKIDFDKNKIIGKTDKLDAVKQAVFLLLKTERNFSEIYKDYGIKTFDLIGTDIYIVISELKRRITEALSEDDRIISLDNFKFNEIDDGLSVEFDVNTIYGTAHMKEVYKL
jgi:hypothetical protein